MKYMAKDKKKATKNINKSILRPRTAYNFFYRYQRDLILKSKASAITKGCSEEYQELSQLLSLSTGTYKTKRPHRKTHGLIGLQQLTKTVAKRWREANSETKDIFTRLAAQDKIRYQNDINRMDLCKSSYVQPIYSQEGTPRIHGNGNLSSIGQEYSMQRNEHVYYPDLTLSTSFFCKYSNQDELLNETKSSIEYEPIQYNPKNALFVPKENHNIPTPPLVQSFQTSLTGEEYDMLNLLISD